MVKLATTSRPASSSTNTTRGCTAPYSHVPLTSLPSPLSRDLRFLVPTPLHQVMLGRGLDDKCEEIPVGTQARIYERCYTWNVQQFLHGPRWPGYDTVDCRRREHDGWRDESVEGDELLAEYARLFCPYMLGCGYWLRSGAPCPSALCCWIFGSRW